MDSPRRGALTSMFGAGYAVSALAGGVIDAFGPAIAKRILRGISKIKGNLTAQKIYKVIGDEVPEFKTVANETAIGALKQIEDANIMMNEMVTKTPSQYIRRSLTPVTIRQSGDQDDIYEENMEKVKSWIEMKDSVIENFYQDNEIMYNVAPVTTSAYFKTYQRAIDFLDKHVPRGTNDYFEEYEPGASQKLQFNRYVEYIENPMKTLEEIKSGYIPTDGINVLANVYPTIHARLIEQFMDDLESGKLRDMPMNKRIEIKTKLGIDLAPNFNPQTFSAIQQNNAQAEAASKINSDMQQRNQTDLVRLQSKA